MLEDERGAPRWEHIQESAIKQCSGYLLVESNGEADDKTTVHGNHMPCPIVPAITWTVAMSNSSNLGKS